MEAVVVRVGTVVFVLVIEAVAVRVGSAVHVEIADRVLDGDGTDDQVAILVGNDVRLAVAVFVAVCVWNADRVPVAVRVEVLDAVAVMVGIAPVSKSMRLSAFDSLIAQKNARPMSRPRRVILWWSLRF